MKYNLSGVLVLVLSVWLQVNFFGGLRPVGIVPNLLLVCLAFWAFLRPASQTITAALVGGLAQAGLNLFIEHQKAPAFYSV